ncbi:hypothetical protein AAG747_28825 [Rapidithrix thailandica]|uniref:Uncharacterized protein n=1 Tax=Rapidithrix thailandica TaxID=413964 RepID=A0AAW9SHJ0_9BACT
MKIYSTASDGNDMADMANARYFNLAIKQIEENVEWLKTSKKIVQAVLAHIDILLLLSKKFPKDANLSIEEDRVAEWKTVFYEWYERVNSKIPAKYREGIKQNADELFAELEQYGH